MCHWIFEAARSTDLGQIYGAVMPNSTIEAVPTGVAAFAASGTDCLIAFGDGSSQDT